MMFDKIIFDKAVTDGMPPVVARLITAQAKHESNNFTSPVFKADNNLFGYKYAGQKLATKGRLSPEGDHYAHYTSVQDSVHELTEWIRRRVHEGVFPEALNQVDTPEQYAQLLKKAGYYGDSLAHYTAGLKHHFQNLNI